ncbi:hypothetical protein M0R45_003220 [Rubus argutus]|uniref:C3H1-type domain-containing protein n=1 Tax=Rubus argutus TaxID=59490 RepID=A0AAW1YEG6_RUBAR
MEEDLLKRHTDCVDFMATPPTCDKGLDCEFRHSKIARLNPKACWYWLAGDCLNPTCAFRHPPLEGHEAAPSESAPSSISANKSNVSCYFYFNGICYKGDRCSFLHDIDGSASTGKCSNTVSACAEALPSENKASVVNETLPALIVTHHNPSETVSKTTVDTRFQPKQDLDDLEQPQKSASPHVYESGDEEADEIRSNSWLPAEGSIHSKSPLCTDQSSEEGGDDLIVQEEWWESSPGFDVLVDGKSENLGFKDSPEYFPTLDGECRELNKEWHNYDNPDEYYPLRPGAEILYENQIYDSYDCLDTRYIFGNERSIPGYAEDKMLDSIFSRKRELMPMELTVDDHDGLDLRNHLRRRRVIDDCSVSGLSRMNESLQLISRSQKWPQRHGTGWQGRMASELGNRTHESLKENEAFGNAGIQRRPHRHSQQYRSRKHQERRLTKSQFPSSGFSRKPVPKEKRSSASTIFTGPKSLAQIKEENRKAEENGGGIRKSRRVLRTRSDFQGPKPLTEILKEKRKLADRREGSSRSN